MPSCFLWIAFLPLPLQRGVSAIEKPNSQGGERMAQQRKIIFTCRHNTLEEFVPLHSRPARLGGPQCIDQRSA
jgi:hypothetical protein